MPMNDAKSTTRLSPQLIGEAVDILEQRGYITYPYRAHYLAGKVLHPSFQHDRIRVQVLPALVMLDGHPSEHVYSVFVSAWEGTPLGTALQTGRICERRTLHTYLNEGIRLQHDPFYLHASAHTEEWEAAYAYEIEGHKPPLSRGCTRVIAAYAMPFMSDDEAGTFVELVVLAGDPLPWHIRRSLQEGTQVVFEKNGSSSAYPIIGVRRFTDLS